MSDCICNTSPLLYLHRIEGLLWLPEIFEEVWTTSAVVKELEVGRRKGYDAPDPRRHSWLRIVRPRATPSEWLALDLGSGELATMALALEHPDRIVLLDDMLARRTAQAAGLKVWGVLRVLLQAKNQGLIPAIGPFVQRLEDAGMWLSEEIRHRILALAGES